MSQPPSEEDIDWKVIIAEIRRAVRHGADRVEFDVTNGVVRGNEDVFKSTPNDRDK